MLINISCLSEVESGHQSMALEPGPDGWSYEHHRELEDLFLDDLAQRYQPGGTRRRRSCANSWSSKRGGFAVLEALPADECERLGLRVRSTVAQPGSDYCGVSLHLRVRLRGSPRQAGRPHLRRRRRRLPRPRPPRPRRLRDHARRPVRDRGRRVPHPRPARPRRRPRPGRDPRPPRPARHRLHHRRLRHRPRRLRGPDPLQRPVRRHQPGRRPRRRRPRRRRPGPDVRLRLRRDPRADARPHRPGAQAAAPPGRAAPVRPAALAPARTPSRRCRSATRTAFRSLSRPLYSVHSTTKTLPCKIFRTRSGPRSSTP
jgi:hypothetical protein